MSNTTVTMPRELAVRLHEIIAGDGFHEELELAQLIDAPVVERQPTGQWRIPVNGDWFYGTHAQCVRERAEYESTFTELDREESYVEVPEQIWSSPPAPVSVAQHPFADKVIRKLQRFEECASDSDSGGVDIGRHWLDLLTQIGLLNRVQRSPALWEITQQGEDCLDKVKELNQ